MILWFYQLPFLKEERTNIISLLVLKSLCLSIFSKYFFLIFVYSFLFITYRCKRTGTALWYTWMSGRRSYQGRKIYHPSYDFWMSVYFAKSPSKHGSSYWPVSGKWGNNCNSNCYFQDSSRRRRSVSRLNDKNWERETEVRIWDIPRHHYVIITSTHERFFRDLNIL